MLDSGDSQVGPGYQEKNADSVVSVYRLEKYGSTVKRCGPNVRSFLGLFNDTKWSSYDITSYTWNYLLLATIGTSRVN